MAKPCPVCHGAAFAKGALCFRCAGKGQIQAPVHRCDPDPPGFCRSCIREREDAEADFRQALIDSYVEQQYKS